MQGVRGLSYTGLSHAPDTGERRRRCGSTDESTLPWRNGTAWTSQSDSLPVVGRWRTGCKQAQEFPLRLWRAWLQRTTGASLYCSLQVMQLLSGFAAAAGKTSGIAGSLINTSDAGNEAGSELESENLGGRAAGEGRLRALGWPSPTGGEGQVGSESLPPLVRHLSFLHPRLSPRPRRFSRRRLPSSPPPSPPCQVPGRRPLIRSTSPGRVPQHRRTTPSLAPLAPLPLSLLYYHRRQESKLSRGRRTPRDNQHWAMASFPLLSTPIHLASAHDQPREEALTSIASHLKSRKLSPLSLAL